jgi:hypothetical protein
MLVDAAQKVVARMGSDTQIEGRRGTIREAEFRDICISYRGPKAEIIDAPSVFGIDVWFHRKKTLNVCWNSNLIRDFELVTLKRGPWIADLLFQAASIPVTERL